MIDEIPLKCSGNKENRRHKFNILDFKTFMKTIYPNNMLYIVFVETVGNFKFALNILFFTYLYKTDSKMKFNMYKKISCINLNK